MGRPRGLAGEEGEIMIAGKSESERKGLTMQFHHQEQYHTYGSVMTHN